MARAISHLQQRDLVETKRDMFHVNKQWCVCSTPRNTEGKKPHGIVNRNYTWLESVQRECPTFSLSSSYSPGIKMMIKFAGAPDTLLWSYWCGGLHRLPQKCLAARDGSLLCVNVNAWIGSLNSQRLCIWPPFLSSFSLCFPHLTLPWFYSCILSPHIG